MPEAVDSGSPCLARPDLGEITRNIILHFIDSGILFEGWSTSQLNAHYGLDTAVMSKIEAAADADSSSTSPSSSSSSSSAPAYVDAIRQIIVKEMGVPVKRVSDTDVEIVKWAVMAVGTRAAQMSACAIATVIAHTEGETNKDSTDIVDVGIDGRSVARRPSSPLDDDDGS